MSCQGPGFHFPDSLTTSQNLITAHPFSSARLTITECVIIRLTCSPCLNFPICLVTKFQKILRDIRSDLQRDVYTEPLRRRFPKVLVGNYAVYPNDGFRYWYDYFEKPVPGASGLGGSAAPFSQYAVRLTHLLAPMIADDSAGQRLCQQCPRMEREPRNR